MTATNDEALQITGLLTRKRIPAKLIQSNDGFNLYNLLEIRYFLHKLYNTDNKKDSYIVDDDAYKAAKASIVERFKDSPNLESCMSIINDFEAVNTRNKYRTDLDIFIRESRLEDFYSDKIDMVFVSTIHKAKGREFDNVYIVLSNFSADTDEKKRQLYVAMTRAKSNLEIHYNRPIFNSIAADGIITKQDTAAYQPPDELTIQLTHRDIWLDCFFRCQKRILNQNPGDSLFVDETGCKNKDGFYVLKFSGLFFDKLQHYKNLGFAPKAADIRFIVYWTKDGSDREIRIVLPRVHFIKNYRQEGQL